MKTKVFFLLSILLVIAYSCNEEMNDEVINQEALPLDAPKAIGDDVLPIGPVEEFELPLSKSDKNHKDDELIELNDVEDKVGTRSENPYPDPFDLQATESIACGSSRVGSLNDAQNLISNDVYNHFGLRANLNGGDNIYTFELNQRSIMTFDLSHTIENLAMVLFKTELLNGYYIPDPLAPSFMYLKSVVGVTSSSSINGDVIGPLELEPGSYALVVDSAPGYWSDYRLRVSCSPVSSGCTTGPLFSNSIALLQDDFEDYSLGNLSPQASHWKKFYPTAAYDVLVGRSGDNQYSYFGRLNGVSSYNQPNELLYVGNRIGGNYALSMKMWIYNGRSAYFNMQRTCGCSDNNENIANAEFYFRSGGTGEVKVGDRSFSFTYPNDQWMDIQLNIDLTTRQTILYINGIKKVSWSAASIYGSNRIDAFQFYPYATNSQFFIDDICFSKL